MSWSLNRRKWDTINAKFAKASIEYYIDTCLSNFSIAGVSSKQLDSGLLVALVYKRQST